MVYEIRESHLAVEREMGSGQVGTLSGDTKDLVVLDATRIETYLNCEERFRNEYEDNLRLPAGEALLAGTAFHAGVAEYYRQIQEMSNGGDGDARSV